MITNILLSGVGGQGIITASKVIIEAALSAEFNVKKSEVHGMSQRGGSVESHVRFSRDEPVYSPLIPLGSTDMLMAFELLEALRSVPMVKPDGLILVDDRQIVPMSVTTGAFEYPADAMDRLYASGRDVRVVRSFQIASGLGESRAANIVMLGAASSLVDLPRESWDEAIRSVVKPKAVELNLEAFRAGIEALRTA